MSIDKNHINLLVTIDRNYIGPLSVMLKSYIETNRGVTTDLYIAHSSLGKDEFDRIGEIAKSGDVRVHDMKITERWFSEIPVLERLPEESFYRLLAFHFLPKDLGRCLYLDPDIIIRKSCSLCMRCPWMTVTLRQPAICVGIEITSIKEDWLSRSRTDTSIPESC